MLREGVILASQLQDVTGSLDAQLTRADGMSPAGERAVTSNGLRLLHPRPGTCAEVPPTLGSLPPLAPAATLQRFGSLLPHEASDPCLSSLGPG